MGAAMLRSFNLNTTLSFGLDNWKVLLDIFDL